MMSGYFYKADSMMYRSRFKAYTAAMQNKLKEANNSGVFARIIAWVVLGMLLVIGIAVFVFMLLLSWLLIPIMIWRGKKRMAGFQNQAKQHGAAQQNAEPTAHRNQPKQGRVFDAEVIDKSE